MEEEFTIIVAAVSTYLGLPPGRIDLKEASNDKIIPAIQFPGTKQSQSLNKQLWKWSLTTAHRNNFSQIKVDLEQGLSHWRQANL